jgi:lipoic acid synthetase
LTQRRLPPWLTISPSGGEAAYARVRSRLAAHQLHTVCEEARCPNRAECWGAGTATLLLLGDVCTRGCRFCAVKTGDPGGAVDRDEPERAARTADELGLDYVVLTSVDRDDLPDGGASVYAAAARAIVARRPGCRVEVLTPDFRGDRAAIATVLAAPVDVFGHNVEVVRRLGPVARDRRASYDLSLRVLRTVKELDPARLTKSSLMLGLGETTGEVEEALADMRAAAVDIVTLGQYLRPSRRQLPVQAYLPPEHFAALAARARELGLRHVVAGPFVRSSHRARAVFESAQRPAGEGPTPGSVLPAPGPPAVAEGPVPD